MSSALGTGPRVLLVDDTPANLLALSAVLQPVGAALLEARSGEEAIALVKDHWFAAILLDVQMPGMDGFDTAARIRRMERGREVPIIFVTAIHRDQTFVVRGYEAGAADYVTKPYDAAVIRARVKAFVDLFQQRERDRRARLEASLDQAPALVWILGVPGYVCEFANAELRRALGGHEPVGRTALDLGATIEIVRALDVVVSTGCVRSIAEYPYLSAGGQPTQRLGDHLYDVTFQPLTSAEGRVEGVLCFAVDVTAKVRAKSEVERARARAEDANRAKDDFLARVSHELRTPLSAILGWARVAQRSALPEEAAHAIEVILHNAQAEAHLIDDIVEVARTGASGASAMELAVRPTSIGKVVEAVVESLRPLADKRDVTVVTDADDAGTLDVDADRVEQVVWNVLSNAIKFSEEGGCVTVQAERLPGSVSIRVTDGGKGIDAAFLPHVFEPFRQGDGGATRNQGGLGLGLAIARRIVEAHGGSMSASSAGPGQGATITVELPASPAARPLRRAPALSRPVLEPSPRSEASLGDLHLLVVDDEPDARMLLEEVFSQSGATVVCAPDAGAALAKLRAAPPDVLISDIGMPDVDGYAFIEQVRRLPPEEGGDVPAIALTAYTRAEDVARALAAGFQVHAAKPVDPTTLVSSVAMLARRAQ